METDSSKSSSEESPEHSLANETYRKGGKFCSISDERKPVVGITDKKRKESSSGLIQMDDQLKYLVHLSKTRTTDVSAENKPHRDQDSHLSKNEKTQKFERNLQKFMKEREPLKELHLRKKTEISARVAKSDGEIAKIIDYCGDVLRLSSTKSERSSAPPTLSNETGVKEKSQTENILNKESNNKKVSKAIAQNSDIFKKVSLERKNSSPEKALDLRLGKVFEFKVPISPDQKLTPNKSAKRVTPGSKEDDVTPPVQRRPTHFNFRPKKAFYTFSPSDSSSGVLRQCQSLPNINRPRRKDEVQRRSINFGEHSRIVRSLFKDIPEPVTPESKISTFHKSSNLSMEPESTDTSSEEDVAKILQQVPSKICRNLFSSCSNEAAHTVPKTMVKNVSCVAEVQKNTASHNVPLVGVPITVQNLPSKSCGKTVFGSSSNEANVTNQQTRVLSDEESPPKRKHISSIEAECSISTKKVRTSLETKIKDSGNSEIVSKDESLVVLECPISAKKNFLETKSEESGNAELVKVECSISAKKAISSGAKLDSNVSSENVRKNENPIDVECFISAKKVRTSSEAKIEENKNSG